MPVPPDLTMHDNARDLLVRIDVKVENIVNTLDRIDRKLDSHEIRIASLETWRAESEGKAQGVGNVGKIIGWTLAFLTGGGAVFLGKLFV